MLLSARIVYLVVFFRIGTIRPLLPVAADTLSVTHLSSSFSSIEFAILFKIDVESINLVQSEVVKQSNKKHSNLIPLLFELNQRQEKREKKICNLWEQKAKVNKATPHSNV